MISTPATIQILSPSGILLTSCVVEYAHIDETLKRIEPLCALRGYSHRVMIPHTPDSLISWLKKEPKTAIFESMNERPVIQS